MSNEMTVMLLTLCSETCFGWSTPVPSVSSTSSVIKRPLITYTHRPQFSCPKPHDLWKVTATIHGCFSSACKEAFIPIWDKIQLPDRGNDYWQQLINFLIRIFINLYNSPHKNPPILNFLECEITTFFQICVIFLDITPDILAETY